MRWEQSDSEDSVVETGSDRFVDATAETEVELHLPLEVDMEPDAKIHKDILSYPVHVRNNQTDVPGTGPTPTER